MMVDLHMRSVSYTHLDVYKRQDYYTADEAAVKALQAGADMILMPEDFETAYQGVLDAVKMCIRDRLR